jgi:hypothetical protein
MRRFVGAMVVALLICGYVLADEFRGSVTKVEDGSVTVKSFGGKDKKGEEKTFKVSKDVKITRTAGKDKEEVKLTLDELKTAIKVTNVFVTVTHDGDNATEIKTGGGFGGFGKDKKGKDKKEDK